jgi:hypothetical protein
VPLRPALQRTLVATCSAVATKSSASRLNEASVTQRAFAEGRSLRLARDAPLSSPPHLPRAKRRRSPTARVRPPNHDARERHRTP